MSLYRLLALGRSVIGLKSEPPRYKMAQENFLPKFDTPKTAAVNAVVGVVPAGAPAQLVPAAAAFSEMPAMVTPAGGPLTSRSVFTNRFKSRNTSKATRAWVQGELTFGALKVMRNDLSDTDFELVPARPEKRRQTVTAPQADPAQAGRSRGWSQLTARLFEAGGLRT